MPVIGYFSGRSPVTDGPMLSAFRQGFSEAGFVEGRNVAIEFRWAEGRYERLPQLVHDSFLVRLRLLSPVAARPRHRRPRRRPRLFQSSSISGATPWRRVLSPVSGFRCTFHPGMPSSMTPGSSIIDRFQSSDVDIGLRRDLSGSALP